MTKIFVPISIIFFAAALRLLPHPPNVVPIGAMSLFGGAYLNKKYGLIVPLLAMFISDIFLGFHETMPYVYGSFFLIGCIGLWLKNHKTLKNVVFGSLCSSILFYIITNFGVWYSYNFYPKNFQGFIDCYLSALPFFRNTVIGDLVYTAIFFGSYELIFKLYGSKSLYQNRG